MADDIQAEAFGSSEKEQLQRRIFECTFAMLAKLSSADGSTSKAEVLAIDNFIKNVLKLNKARRDYAVRVFNEARRSSRPFSAYAADYRELLRDKPQMFEWMIDVMLRVSLADHVLSANEEMLLQEACREFGISGSRYAALRSKYVKQADDKHYRLLGLERGCSREELEASFQTAREQFDPQRIIALGLPEDFVKLAEEKFAELKLAYEEVLKDVSGKTR